MINSMFTGFFYGVMFYRQPRVTLRRCIVARLGVVLVVNLLLNPLWMSMTMGNTFIYYCLCASSKTSSLSPLKSPRCIMSCRSACASATAKACTSR